MEHAARNLSGGKRIRAHANPLSDLDYEEPLNPDHVNVPRFYPTFLKDSEVDYPNITIADIGCGFAGLLVTLSRQFPENLCLGLEIRGRAVEDDQARIVHLREQFATGEPEPEAAEQPQHQQHQQHHQQAKRQKLDDSRGQASAEEPDQEKQQSAFQVGPAVKSDRPPFSNIWVMCSNAMRSMPNYFRKGQLEKLFFTFPDPHFKRTKHRRRIINQSFLAQYTYVLKSGGLLYTITDVKDLHMWMAGHCDRHPQLRRLEFEEWRDDPCVASMAMGTEEGQRVTKNRGHKYVAVYRRL